MPFVVAGGHRLEYEWTGLGDAAAPAIVLLHQGLGSLALWREFPRAVHEATGLRVLTYSRWGYGKSEPVKQLPRGKRWMHEGALTELPELLAALGVARPILVGHSDGATIALLYAAHRAAPAALGVLAMAPHVILEKESIVSLAKARLAYEEGDLRGKLARFHDDVDGAFYQWNVTWLMPELRDWSIVDELAGIACPTVLIQGEGDEYGTPEQIHLVARQVGPLAETHLLKNCGHSPHLERPALVLTALQRLCRRAGGVAQAA
jgi:pimeloyl-ACP methyl ester carboxylesterase